MSYNQLKWGGFICHGTSRFCLERKSERLETKIFLFQVLHIIKSSVRVLTDRSEGFLRRQEKTHRATAECLIKSHI